MDACVDACICALDRYGLSVACFLNCFFVYAAYEPRGIDNKANPANIYSAEILASNTPFCFSQIYQLQQKDTTTGQNNVAYLCDLSCTDLLVFGDFIPNRKEQSSISDPFELICAFCAICAYVCIMPMWMHAFLFCCCLCSVMPLMSCCFDGEQSYVQASRSHWVAATATWSL